MSLKQLHIGKKRGKKPTARGVDGEEMGVAQGNVQGAIFDLQFAHKTPDLHRNKGLAGTEFCAMILSTEEQSSR